MPKKPPSHNNQEIARQNLRRLFGNWNIYDLEDIDSKYEYGQDFMVEIVAQNGDVTGKEFRVQSKVLEGKITKKNIGTTLKISTINYLIELPVPVLLHFIDKPSGNAYVMWFKDWYYQNDRTKWAKQNKKQVNIPISHTLDEKMVKSITKYVEKFYFVHNQRTKADYVNQHSKDHFIEFKVDYSQKSTATIIHSRHDEAIPNVTVDEQMMALIMKNLEVGEATELKGKISISNIPDILFDGESEIEIEGAILIPRLDGMLSHPVRIIFKNDENKIIYSINYLNMKPIQAGTKIRKWQAQLPQSLALCTMEINMETKVTNWSFLPFADINNQFNPRILHEKFKFADIFDEAKTVEVELLEHGYVSKIASQGAIFTDEVNNVKMVVRNIIFIMDKLDIEINMPKTWTNNDLVSMQNVINILKTGIFDSLIAPEFKEEKEYILILESDIAKAKELLTEFEGNSENSILQSYSIETIAKFLDIAVDLGSSELVFTDVRLFNENEVIAQFEANEKTVKLVFTFDHKRSYTQFPRWLSNTE